MRLITTAAATTCSSTTYATQKWWLGRGQPAFRGNRNSENVCRHMFTLLMQEGISQRLHAPAAA
jgi:hypothetical protein